jgi:hypothetical protein
MIPQSQGAQNAQIGAIWTSIEVEHVQKQIGGHFCVRLRG